MTLGTEQPSLRKSPKAPGERRARASPAQQQLRAGPGTGTEPPPRTGARSRDSQSASRDTGKGPPSPAAHGGSPGDPPNWFRAGPAELTGSTRRALPQTAAAGPNRDARCCPARTPRPKHGRSPAPHGGARTAPVQPNPEKPTATALAPFRPPQLCSPDRSTPRSPPTQCSGPVPAHRSDPCPVPPA